MDSDPREKLHVGMGKTGKRIPCNNNFIYGSCFTDLVRNLFIESKYDVIPFGWETFLSFTIKGVKEKKIASDAASKIRLTPDLIVHDNERFEFIEVKARSESSQFPLEDSVIHNIETYYKRFWPEAILLLVIPYKHWFYAQKFDKIEFVPKCREKPWYKCTEMIDDIDINSFLLIEEMFPKIQNDTLYQYKLLASSFFGIFTKYEENISSCPDLYSHFDDKISHNVHLLEFAKNNRTLIDDELFNAYIRQCLISREIFNYDLNVIRKLKLLE